MVLYAVEVQIDPQVAQAWQEWMLKTHIPEVLATGWFRGYRFGEVVDPPSEKRRYLILYETSDHSLLEGYLNHDAPRLRASYPIEFEGRFEVRRFVWRMLP
ncbi:MAG: DUF4286 family protein [Bacteroidia bacterium]